MKAFLDGNYNVVGNALEITTSNAFEASDKLALVDGSIADAATAAKIAEVAKNKFNRLMRWSIMRASISRNTSRITRSTIFVLLHRTSKVFSWAPRWRLSRCWLRTPVEASLISARPR